MEDPCMRNIWPTHLAKGNYANSGVTAFCKPRNTWTPPVLPSTSPSSAPSAPHSQPSAVYTCNSRRISEGCSSKQIFRGTAKPTNQPTNQPTRSDSSLGIGILIQRWPPPWWPWTPIRPRYRWETDVRLRGHELLARSEGVPGNGLTGLPRCVFWGRTALPSCPNQCFWCHFSIQLEIFHF